MSRLPRDDERFARVLDGDEPPRDPSAAGMVAVVERVRALGRDAGLDPDPAFRAALRERLLAEAPGTLPHPRTPDGPDSPHAVLARTYNRSARVAAAAAVPAARSPLSAGRPARTAVPVRPAPAARPARTSRGRGRRRVLVTGALVVVALSGSTMVASGDALPGERLYGLKRTVESVETALVRDDAEKGRRHLRLARARADEISRIAAAPGHTDDLLGTLNEMDAETREGFRLLATAAVTRTDPGALAELTVWVGQQQALVDGTWPQLPGAARQRVGDSMLLLRTASSRAVALADLPACACPAPPSDELGPLPVGCAGCPRPAKGLVPGPVTATAVPVPRPSASPRGPVPASTAAVPPPVAPPVVSPQPSAPPVAEPTPTVPPTSSPVPGQSPAPGSRPEQDQQPTGAPGQSPLPADLSQVLADLGGILSDLLGG